VSAKRLKLRAWWPQDTCNNWLNLALVSLQDPTISTTAVAIRDKRAYIDYAWFAEAFGGKQRSEFYMQVVDFKFDATYSWLRLFGWLLVLFIGT
jgi:hypothetical protein